MNKVEQRPAESAGVAGAVGLLICKIAGVEDPDTYFAVGVVIGFVPAAITWCVNTIRQRN